MNLIVDANILFSALYKPDSKAGALLMFSYEERVDLLSTEHVYKEMLRICKVKLYYSHGDAWEVINHLPVEWIEYDIYIERVRENLSKITDEGDASLLALASMTGYPVITGDRELLNLNGVGGISVLPLGLVVNEPKSSDDLRKQPADEDAQYQAPCEDDEEV